MAKFKMTVGIGFAFANREIEFELEDSYLDSLTEKEREEAINEAVEEELGEILDVGYVEQEAE